MKEKGTRDSLWPGNEYLQIYPSVRYENGTNYYNNGQAIPQEYYIVKPSNADGMWVYTFFKNWLNHR